MAFDASFLSGVLDEIREVAQDARVEKIHEPTRDTILLHLRCRQGRARLLIVANPAAPRLHLTETSPENPDSPPMFCMLLRKHLLGGKLLGIEQSPMERLAVFRFLCTDELGDQVEKRLVVELMGRTSNIYLLDKDGRILDCLRRVGLDESAKRQALPGLYYQTPEPLSKVNPAEATADSIAQLLREPGADRLSERIMDVFGGLSPLTAREAALSAAGDMDARLEHLDIAAVSEKLANFFAAYLTGAGRGPYLVQDSQGTPKAYAFCPIYQYGSEPEKAPSFQALLDGYYAQRDHRELMRQKAQGVRKTVQNHLERVRRKMVIQNKELEATYGRERLRQLGDIVTANLQNIARGQARLTAVDFYDEEMKEIDIPLQTQLSPQQNAAKFYKDYAKAKTAEKILTAQLSLGETESQYLQSVLEELERAGTEAELEEIRQELIQGNYLRPQPGKKRMKVPASRPMAFRSTQGYPILVGRNNRQNDELTGKIARKDDLWLHVQKLHGCHVIIRCAGAPVADETITEAATLAALYSQAKNSQNVAVDVTPVKFVKKPAGSKPGMAVYYQYRTVYVSPDPSLPEKLEKN